MNPAPAGERRDTVLLAGLDPRTRDAILPALSSEGFGHLLVPGYAEALSALDPGPVDAVLLSVEVCDERLTRFLAALRGRRGPGRLPVLVVTPVLSHETMRELHLLGVADVLLRPVDPEDLVRRLREAMRESQRKVGPSPGALPADRGSLAGVAEDVLAALSAWIVVADADLRIVYANRPFAASLGVVPDELTGAELEASLLPGLASLDEALRRVRDVLGTGVRASVKNLRFRDGAGDMRVVDLEIAPTGVPGGRRAVLVLHDVTEHWFAERSVEQEKRKLEDIVNGMGAGLAVLSPDLRVQWANRTFLEWFGDRWGKPFDHALRGLGIVGEIDPRRVFTGREHVSKEWTHFTAQGDRRYYRNVIVPARDALGALREVVVVTQDMTGATLRSEQHRLLQELTELVQGTLELDRLLYIILTCCTAGHALGFNRAFAFLADEAGGELRGELAVGPGSRDEAFTIWSELAGSGASLADLTAEYDAFRAGPQPLSLLVRGLRYPTSSEAAASEVLVRAFRDNRIQHVRDSGSDPRVSADFRGRFQARELVCLPLQAKGRVIGVLLADNLYSGRPISEEQVAMFELFGAPAGLAVDNARTYAELKRSMARLQTAQDALLHSERLATVGRLAAHVAHEIRNPLTTIGGFARSIARRAEDAERVRSGAAVIAEEVARLEGLLSEIMDFTRPQRPVPEFRPLREAVDRIVETMGPEVRAAGVELAVEETLALPPVPHDPKQLHQVLVNLVRNAVEAMSENEGMGGRARRVVLRLSGTAETALLEVEDTGPGVPAELRTRIFEPFFSRKQRGTGLGLVVVRKILMDHGGDVSVRPAPGGGACFVLSLPLVPARAPGSGADAEPARG